MPADRSPLTNLMDQRSFVARRLALVVAFATAIVALTACATRTPQQFSPTYSGSDALLLFEDAFTHIQRRYVEPVSIAPLALQGVRALMQNGNGGSLQIIEDGDSITLQRQAVSLARYNRPTPDDATGWAKLTADILLQASQAEATLHAMPAEELYQMVMDGVVNQLDPFSRYENARMAANQKASREGFVGIGVTIKTESGLTHVVEVLKDTPAAMAGLAVGDLLTSADGVPLKDMDGSGVVDRLRGAIGSSVDLTLQRGVPPRTLAFTLRRDFIIPATVEGRREDNVIVLPLTGFNVNTAAEVKKEYMRLESARSRLAGIILDLRGNPGGLLGQAVQVADLFLDHGLMVSTLGRHPASNSSFTADSQQIAAEIPIVILTNGDSASASELLAAALQDRGRAVVIGTATHGKGTVQNLVEMPNGGELVLTWSRMHAPSGYVLDGLGVLPNICTADQAPVVDAFQVSAKVEAYTRHAAAWHDFRNANAEKAAALRQFCPATLNVSDSDMALAKRLLHDPALYQRALAPAVESAAAGSAYGSGQS
jgi:carboxyl-terminal processing protease